MANEGGRYFFIELENSRLKKQSEEVKKAFSDMADEAVRQGKEIDEAFSVRNISGGMVKEFARLEKLSVEAFGGITENARRMVSEIQEDTLALSNVQKMMQALEKAYSDGTISQNNYIKAASRLTVLQENIANAIQDNEEALRRESRQLDVAGDSILSMQAKVALLTTEYMKLSEAQRNSVQGEGLLKNISDMQSRLASAQAAMEKFGAATNRSYNGIGMSIQQIARELPALAMGPQMFFLAISNNLPMFTDELARARKEYQLLTKAGKAATPVWKQVASSLLSWQTVLAAGIAIFSLYGNEIVAFATNLFKAGKEAEKASDIQDNINKRYIEGADSVGKQITALKTLQDRWNELGDDMSGKSKFIEDNASEFNKLGVSIKDVSDAENLLVDNTGDFIEALKLRAQAAAAQELASERYAEQLRLEMEAREEAEKATAQRMSNETSWWYGQQSTQSAYNRQGIQERNEEIARGIETNVRRLEEEAKAAKEAGDAYFDLASEREKAVDSLMDNAGIDKYVGGSSSKRGKSSKYERPLTVSVPDEDVDLITPEEVMKSVELHREMMDKYLIDYGTYQQKREAIADSYAMRIANAETEGERLSLQKKMEEALSAIDLEQFKEGINWELIFGDVSKASKKALDEMRAQLERFRDSQEYKDMTVEQKEVIDSALNEIKSTMIENGGLLGDLPNQLNALREAQEELTVAQEEYNRALESGTEAEKQQARSNLNAAQNRVATQEANVSRATEKTINSMRTLSGAIAQLGSDSEITLTELGGMAESIGSLFGEMGSKIGGIIGAALSVLDQIGQQGVEGFTENLNKSLAGAARSLLEYGTFGLIDFGGLSNRNVDSDIDRLTNSNEALRDALDRLTEKMEESAVSEANDIYELQKANILAQEANTRKMMLEYGSVHDDGFLGIGGSHSSFKYIDDAMDAKDWERISQVVGQSVRNASDFFNLSSENMAAVADEATDLYAKIKQYADDGTRDAAQYMDDYIQYYKDLEELEDSRNERLTSVSFDTVRDNFKSALLDMESDSEDFAQNFSDMMGEAIIESLMSEKYDKLLKNWYGNFAEAMADGVLTELERDSLRKEYDSIVNQGLADRDALSSVLGSSVEDQGTSQKATAGGYEVMSEDTGSELNGRFTAIQMTVEAIKARIEVGGSNMDAIRYNAEQLRDIVQNCYVELVEINQNTWAIVKPIQQMQRDISDMRNDIREKL